MCKAPQKTDSKLTNWSPDYDDLKKYVDFLFHQSIGEIISPPKTVQGKATENVLGLGKQGGNSFHFSLKS